MSKIAKVFKKVLMATALAPVATSAKTKTPAANTRHFFFTIMSSRGLPVPFILPLCATYPTLTVRNSTRAFWDTRYEAQERVSSVFFDFPFF